MSLHKTVHSWADKLHKMQSEPASKEWFAKHGSPKGTALAKIQKKTPRKLSDAERAEKTKNWPKHTHHLSDKDKSDYQKRTGRGYHE